jgi:alpha-beta hydrolase superfamily lysophospholipase
MNRASATGEGDSVRLEAGAVALEGNLSVPEGTSGVVLFAHGSGSGRHSPRNRFVAHVLRDAGLATFLIDLLTPGEEAVDACTAHLRFDIGLLTERLIAATDWLAHNAETADLDIGYFGASTGAAAALLAAAERPERISAVVLRGGRPDLAGHALSRALAPTLLLVGGNDRPVIELNLAAMRQIGATDKHLVVIPGATHLFEEPGALEAVAGLAADWFTQHLGMMVDPRRARDGSRR